RERFELPPVPPRELFDARFGSGAYVEDAASPVVRFQGVSYPVDLQLDGPASAEYTVTDAAGRTWGTLRNGSGVRITDPTVTAVQLLMHSAVAAPRISVKPQPATDRAIVELALPTTAPVILKLYSMVGEEIATVYAGELAAGTHTIELPMGLLSNGHFVLRAALGPEIRLLPVVISR
ncbi:MAG: hypothetical protein NZ949_05650, partial [Candidatus Kapabacteria bacterium]|nr:hypothetical protein [Candidatus Kapabacteria bacterium]MDW7996579.1 hypothetical protein [Bacteroidota bacterium]